MNFDHLSIVSEENLTNSDDTFEVRSCGGVAETKTETSVMDKKSKSKQRNCSEFVALHDFQSVVPPLAHFENLCYEKIGPNLG